MNNLEREFLIEEALDNYKAIGEPTITYMKDILDEALKIMKEDCYDIDFPVIVDKPKGIQQPIENNSYFDHEYIDQHIGSCADDYYGTTYLPLPDGRYLQVGYRA